MPAWVLLLQDGSLHQGEGERPVDQVVARARNARGGRFLFDGLPPIYVAGPASLMVTHRMTVGEATTERFWSLGLSGRLWVAPDGSIAIAETFEAAMEIGALIEAALAHG